MKLLHRAYLVPCFVTAFIASGEAASSQRMDAKPSPLEITVVLAKSTFPIAERIPVFVKLTNKSDHEVLVGALPGSRRECPLVFADYR